MLVNNAIARNANLLILAYSHLEEIVMREVFLGRNGKPLISGIVNLSIVSLITATTFMFTSMAFAHDAPSFCAASSTHIPRNVSRASCLNLVTNIIADPGQTKLVQIAPLCPNCKHS